MTEPLRLTIRVFSNGIKRSEQRITLEPEALDTFVADMADKHAAMMTVEPAIMVEIEFMDDLNPNERFFRIGTDASSMVLPHKVDLTKPIDSILSRWGRKPS